MSDISGPLILIAVAVVVVLAIAMSVRRVKPDSRLVVFRMGRTNESLVLGPGWVFLMPILDRPVTVTLRPQHFVIENLPAKTTDERDIGVDLDLSLRVHDPLRFVVAIVTPAELGLRGLARATVKRVAAGMSVGDALTSRRLEEALRPALEGLLPSAVVRRSPSRWLRCAPCESSRRTSASRRRCGRRRACRRFRTSPGAVRAPEPSPPSQPEVQHLGCSSAPVQIGWCDQIACRAPGVLERLSRALESGAIPVPSRQLAVISTGRAEPGSERPGGGPWRTAREQGRSARPRLGPPPRPP